MPRGFTVEFPSRTMSIVTDDTTPLPEAERQLIRIISDYIKQNIKEYDPNAVVTQSAEVSGREPE